MHRQRDPRSRLRCSVYSPYGCAPRHNIELLASHAGRSSDLLHIEVVRDA